MGLVCVDLLGAMHKYLICLLRHRALSQYLKPQWNGNNPKQSKHINKNINNTANNNNNKHSTDNNSTTNTAKPVVHQLVLGPTLSLPVTDFNNSRSLDIKPFLTSNECHRVWCEYSRPLFLAFHNIIVYHISDNTNNNNNINKNKHKNKIRQDRARLHRDQSSSSSSIRNHAILKLKQVLLDPRWSQLYAKNISPFWQACMDEVRSLHHT